MQADEEDPDYNEFHNKEVVDPSKRKELETKKRTINKIENILREQFHREIEAKSLEISSIDKRVRHTKAMLDRLRAYVVASYYGTGAKLIPMSKSLEIRSASGEKIQPDNNLPIVRSDELLLGRIPSSRKMENENSFNVPLKKENNSEVCTNIEMNRFYVMKEIYVGNVSKYLVNDSHKEKDKVTHKWMVYVRGPRHEPDISSYVKSVWFFLHPSYIPNDIVQVYKPPFQLTRRGWGEFPIRIQLHFKDANNKRFDIIHNLKLDKTYTGLQTLGAETVVKLELRRHSEEDFHLNATSISASLQQNANDSYKPSSKSSSCDTILDETILDEISHNETKTDVSVQKKDPLSRIKQIEELSSVVSSCVTSAAASRCTSPVDFEFSKHSVTNEETDILLRELIIDAPLIHPTPDMRLRPFSCVSMDLYKNWSFSKRRASEWQRCVFLKRLLVEYVEAHDKVMSIPTTKQIMLWCRQNGYTPTEKHLEVVDDDDSLWFCPLCGNNVDPNEGEGETQLHWCAKCISKKNQEHVSLSSFASLFAEIKQKEEALVQLKKLQSENGNSMADTKDVDVDITTISQDEDFSETLLEKAIVSSTDELDWIYKTTSELGIHLPAVDVGTVRAPIIQAMLLSAMKCFISELIRKSNSEAVCKNKNTLKPVLVTFNHVSRAIRKTPKFDFLSDAHMGR